MLIKLWDWEKKWSCTQVFEGHTHYVMQIVINPKDNNTFASASLDRTVKVYHHHLHDFTAGNLMTNWHVIIIRIEIY
jgi:WD40 repeat protein